MPDSTGPMLVFGPRSTTYDFGPGHPLTPRRFGPGIDLLRSVGASPGLAPEPASDADLERIHLPEYLATVRRLSAEPSGRAAMGIGLSDNPPFAGMHEASAAVAGGSLAAMEAILRGDIDHAHHPGGGLHHAMAAQAWGFCVYNDPALAVVRARAEGLRVMYIDLDVHHGDGVQVMTYEDPGVLTLSLHESGRYLFPGTGGIDELGEGAAVGTSVNLPFEPYAGPASWLPAVHALLPTLAAVFGPDVIVSQHGADSHAWDPLAHLRMTTTAMSEAARLVDTLAHRWAGGRWLATGGGGYDAYRVVPRAWAVTWLAGAHREVPSSTPRAWRERWADEAAGFGTRGMPTTFLDGELDDESLGDAQRAADARSLETLRRVRVAVLPRLVLEAEDRGWWSAAESVGRHESSSAPSSAVPDADVSPSIRALDADDLRRLRVAERVVSPFSGDDVAALLVAALVDDTRVIGAVSGDSIVGLAVAAPDGGSTESLLALGVAPGFRAAGLGTALLRELAAGRAPGVSMVARIGVAERDVVDPLPIETRVAIARSLLAGAGFELLRASPDEVRDDPWTVLAGLPAG